MRSHLVAWLDGWIPHAVASTVAPGWFACVGLAGLVALFWMLARARRAGIDPGVVASAVLWGYVAAVVAGIVMPMLIDATQQHVTTGHASLRWAGMTSFWGYLAGAAAVAVVCRDHGVSLARFGDLAAAPLGLSLVFARLGCFLAGCDYGKVTSVPWAVRFPTGSPAWRDHVQAGLLPPGRAASLPVHPTELYEALLGLVIVGVSLAVARQRWARGAHGRVFLSALATYAVGRIGVEMFRGDAGRGIYLGLSSGQIFSIVVLAAIAAGFVMTRRRVAPALALGVLMFVIAAPRASHAQPAAAPQPMPAPVSTPAPQPTPGTMVAPAPSAAQPAVSFPPAANTADGQEAAATPGSGLQIGLLLGAATPINRRPDQVATLGGPTVSIGYGLRRFGLWLDIDSFGNADASHGTVLVSASVMGPLRPGGRIGGRFGVGPTLVNFDEPAFRDVAGTTTRLEALVEYDVGRSWTLWFRPLAIDILTARELGGPITTMQLRAGLSYRFQPRRKPVVAPAQQPYPAPPQQPYPQQPYPTPAQQPYPQQPYPQQPYPTPAQQPYPTPAQQPYPQPASQAPGAHPPAAAPGPAPQDPRPPGERPRQHGGTR